MKTISFFILFLLCMVECDAQTFNINSLIGTKWKQIKDYEANCKTIIEFTGMDMVETVTFFTKPEKRMCKGGNSCSRVSNEDWLDRLVRKSSKRNTLWVIYTKKI